MKRRLALVLALGGLLVLIAQPFAAAASDFWGNVAPASPLGAGGLFGRYPLANYALDQHFDAISASLTGGVDAGGLLPMIAYFLASLLWVATSFLANALVTFFGFAFSLDLVNGSQATGGAGALGPVAQAIHTLYGSVFGQPWLVVAVAIAGIWAMWKALVQRRYAETAGALALSLIYIVGALFFVAEPGQTIGAASGWANRMSQGFLAIARNGSPSGGASARDAAADQLFELLVYKPWAVLEFGGLEHCALPGTGGDGDPASAPVRPLASNADRDTQLARRLREGQEVSADGKVCVNNAAKYGRHFLRFGPETDERGAEYDALNDGDSSKLPEADTERGGYRLGPVDKPATDAMEEGGQYQRLLLALVVFGGELGAFCLLGALSVGVILAQVLLLLLLAFAPVALVAAAIPGRGHAFFRAWLEKLAGYLLRKAAYSLLLAVLLAVNGAIADATSAMGWLMSFGLQALFFWAVFLQRAKLTQGLVGIATGPAAPGREGALRVMALYAGARTVGRPLRGLGRATRRVTGTLGGAASGGADRFGGDADASGPRAPAPGPGRGGGASAGDEPAETARSGERRRASATRVDREKPEGRRSRATGEQSEAAAEAEAKPPRRKRRPSAESLARNAGPQSPGGGEPGPEGLRRPPSSPPGGEELPSNPRGEGSPKGKPESAAGRAGKTDRSQLPPAEGSPAPPPRKRRRRRPKADER